MATEPTKLSGKVVNGVVIFDNDESLPEGTEVSIEPICEAPESKPADGRSLVEMLLSHSGVIKDDDLPKDLADNLEHYLYGTPKGQ